jgi:hypothetical protein
MWTDREKCAQRARETVLFPAPGMPLMIQMGLNMKLAAPSNIIGPCAV